MDIKSNRSCQTFKCINFLFLESNKFQNLYLKFELRGHSPSFYLSLGCITFRTHAKSQTTSTNNSLQSKDKNLGLE